MKDPELPGLASDECLYSQHQKNLSPQCMYHERKEDFCDFLMLWKKSLLSFTYDKIFMSFGCIWMNVNIESTVNKSIKANEEGREKEEAKKLLVKHGRKDGIANFSNFINSFFLLLSFKFSCIFDEGKEEKYLFFFMCWSCWTSWL